MKGFIIGLALLVPAFSFAQNQGTITVRKKSQNREVNDVSTDYSSILTDNDSLFTVVEVMPEYIGGMDEMYTYLSKRIKVPTTEIPVNKVYIQFIIEKDGEVSCVETLRAIGVDDETKISWIKAIEQMPKWKPVFNLVSL